MIDVACGLPNPPNYTSGIAWNKKRGTSREIGLFRTTEGNSHVALQTLQPQNVAITVPNIQKTVAGLRNPTSKSSPRADQHHDYELHNHCGFRGKSPRKIEPAGRMVQRAMDVDRDAVH